MSPSIQPAAFAQSTLSGIWTAIATPFDEAGTIDWPAFERLLTLQLEGRVTGIVISGTTGEAPTLAVQEKLAMIRKARAFTKGKMRIMAGSGGNNTEQSIELSRLAEEAGADSLLIVTPPYNKPSQRGLCLHFEAIAKAVSIPLCLYHVPGRTGQKLTADQIAEIAALPQVAAIKEASADLALFSDTRAKTSATMLSGDDITFFPALALGCEGVISVLTNLYPGAFRSLYDAFMAGNISRARAFHFALAPTINALFCESNPGPLKAALASKGVCKNIMRLPLAPVTEASSITISQALKKTDQALAEIH